MKSIIQFKISQSEGSYVAEGVDLAIVTGADTLDNLPENMVDYVRVAIENYRKGITYSEYGW